MITHSQAKKKCQRRPSASEREPGIVAHSGKPRTTMRPSAERADTPSTPVVSKRASPMRVMPRRLAIGAAHRGRREHGIGEIEATPQYSAGCALKICSPLPTSASMHSRLIQCIGTQRRAMPQHRAPFEALRHGGHATRNQGSTPSATSFASAAGYCRGAGLAHQQAVTASNGCAMAGRDFAVEVVLVAAQDLDVDELPGLQPGLAAVLDLHQAVDLRRVGLRARDRELAVDRIDQAALHGADLGFEPRGGNLRLPLHEARQALLLHFLGHRIGQLVGGRAVDRRIGERADAIELRLVEEVEQLLELGFGLAREADDEGRADGEVRADLAPALRCARASCRPRPGASSA